MEQPGRYLVLLCVVALASTLAFAQATTGTLTGNVTTDGAPLPGVTITISSPGMQGTRTTVSNENGNYNFPALPPGAYTVLFEMEGMSKFSKNVQVTLNQTARADANLKLSALAEAITVTAAAASVLETTAVSSNFDQETIENLPIARTLGGAAAIAPGVSDEGPNNQLSISGAPSYNNLYLVNGAVVNDTVRGQPEAVYIEDAIQETTILTGNVSAEYGRFTGGVVSAITKSGGNEFSGSLRDSFTNDKWTEKTPYAGEADHIDKINEVYEATLGGRILRDRLWFFGAGRMAETEASRTTTRTNIPYLFTTDEDRWEAKLTGQITSQFSVVASYLDRLTKQSGNIFGNVVDVRSLDDRELPNTLLAVSGNAVVSNNFLIEAQYSTREFAFVGSGSDFTDRIQGTLLRDKPALYRAWSPTFCGVCDDENRDNEYIVAKATYFLSTAGLGSHSIVGGLEDFAEQRFANNHQSGSDYRIWGDFLYSGQNMFFHVEPGTDGSGTYIQWNPILFGSQGSDSKMQSVFVNDRWDLNSNWSFNIGLRYDKNDSVDQAGNVTAKDDGFSPRLGLTWDIKGDGRHRITAGYNRYVSAIDNGINDNASSAGSPATYYYDYGGPIINPRGCETTNTCLPTDQVIAAVFDWFDDHVNPATDFWYASLPGVNIQINGQLESPYMDEYTIGYGTQLGNGYFRMDYINRAWDNFYVSLTNLDTGTVEDDLGYLYDLTLVRNSGASITREYQAVQIQGNYRFGARFNFGGNYTWSELQGNAESETANNATVSILSSESYPEYIDIAWNNPDRFLNADVEHRANLFLAYDQPLGAFGKLNFSLLERFHSGYPYYADGTISLSLITNPGYESPPATATHYLEGDKAYRTDDVTRTDLGINYSVPIGPIELFLQGELLNLFDEDAVEDPSFINQTVLTSRNSTCRQGADWSGARCAAFNPLTTTPVEGVHFQKSAAGRASSATSFGEPTSRDAYQTPFTYRFSVGLRF